MQKCFLVSNKVTQIRDYLEHRSIIEVVHEHKNLTEIDLGHLGIVDVEKFIYIYYATDDGDLAFRSDLNKLRQMLASAFFHVDEGLFILVDCKNPMLEDLIHSATKGTDLKGTRLTVVHHSGALTWGDASRYIAGTTIGDDTSSSYKTVYIREEESEELERYSSSANELYHTLPLLTDYYTMYSQRAEVESASSSRMVVDAVKRPQILRDFTRMGKPVLKQWNAFLLSGLHYTGFECGVTHLIDYFSRVGTRAFVVDLTSSHTIHLDITGYHTFSLAELTTKAAFSETAGYVKCRYNQLGYVVEMLDNVVGAQTYIFLCEEEDYTHLRDYLSPLCDNLYCNFVTHFTEEAVKDYLSSNYSATTLFLSVATMRKDFDLQSYKEEFTGTRVALFNCVDTDTTDFYECAIGGGMS